MNSILANVSLIVLLLAIVSPGYADTAAGIDQLPARTAPLKGLWTPGDRGYYHDGRFATLIELIEHYDSHFSLGLTQDETHDLQHFLRSL